MKKFFYIIFFLIITNLYSRDVININFFNEVRIDKNKIWEESQRINKFILSQKGMNINIFSGRIIKHPHSDSLLIFALNKMVCTLSTPTDFHFSNPVIRPDFKILAVNIKNKRLPIRKRYIIKNDSLKIAILAVYTPDTFIKNRLSKDAVFDYDFIKRLKEEVNELKQPKYKISKIILLSNLSKPIDKEIAKKVPVDIILSFDYKKRSMKKLTKTTTFYSVLSKNRKVGKLKLIYEKGKIIYDWQILSY